MCHACEAVKVNSTHHGVGWSSFLAELAEQSSRFDRAGNAHMAGFSLGQAMHAAHLLVDNGADPVDVRDLLALGLRAGGAP